MFTSGSKERFQELSECVADGINSVFERRFQIEEKQERTSMSDATVD